MTVRTRVCVCVHVCVCVCVCVSRHLNIRIKVEAFQSPPPPLSLFLAFQISSVKGRIQFVLFTLQNSYWHHVWLTLQLWHHKLYTHNSGNTAAVGRLRINFNIGERETAAAEQAVSLNRECWKQQRRAMSLPDGMSLGVWFTSSPDSEPSFLFLFGEREKGRS